MKSQSGTLRGDEVTKWNIERGSSHKVEDREGMTSQSGRLRGDEVTKWNIERG